MSVIVDNKKIYDALNIYEISPLLLIFVLGILCVIINYEDVIVLQDFCKNIREIILIRYSVRD